MVVEASWGLGESVVGGLVTPDRFVLDREGRILEAVIGDKATAVYADPAGATIWRRPPDPAAACVGASVLAALALLGRR